MCQRPAVSQCYQLVGDNITNIVFLINNRMMLQLLANANLDIHDIKKQGKGDSLYKGEAYRYVEAVVSFANPV